MSDFISATVFSGVGFVAFVYGKRMGHWTPMLCGLGLMVLPLFFWLTLPWSSPVHA